MNTVHPELRAAEVPYLTSVRNDHGQIELVGLDRSGAHPIGTFASIADAWTAIDALDCAALGLPPR